MTQKASQRCARSHPHEHRHAPCHANCILRLYEEMNKNPDGWVEVAEKHGVFDTAKYQFHMLNIGKSFDWATSRAMQAPMMKALSNRTFSVCEIIESGDRVNVRVMVTGVHSGELNLPGVGAIPASNKFFRAYSMATYHFCEGKIVEVFMVSTLVDALKAAAAQP